MKMTIRYFLLTFLVSLTTSAPAQTYFCSFSDQKMGVLQIDIDQKNIKICQYQKQNNQEWKKMESGQGHYTGQYFDNNRYETMNSYNVLTLKRDVQLRMAKNFVEGSQISITWSTPSKFGPLISSGYASVTSAHCFIKQDAKACEADKFEQPTNTPIHFEKLKRILETNERDWWGDQPTFTLVSPNLEEFEVYHLITDKVIEACSFGCVSSKKEEIIQKRIKPRLKLGWTLVPVYSNENGIELFQQL